MARELHGDAEHCRLLIAFRRASEAAEQTRRIGRIMLESGESLPDQSGAAEPGDLRGIPVIGHGVGGAIPGTKPGTGKAFDEWRPPQAFRDPAESMEA